MSLGLASAGVKIVGAADIFPAAIDTYQQNFSHPVWDEDLASFPPLPKADIIVGGPPCQGFSSAGVRRVQDVRNSLVEVFASIIVANRPKAFVFENVEGFLTAEDGERVISLLSPLLAAGYHIHLQKVNMAEYGVPQHRKRVIGIGGLGWTPSFPVATHRPFGAPGNFSKHTHLPPAVTLSEALNGLSEPSLEKPGNPQGHFYRPLAQTDEKRAEAMRPGQTMKDLPPALQHGSYQRRANRRVSDGTASDRRGGAPTGLRRLNHDEPSKAITGGAKSEFLHPTQNRNLTVRECARIQTFPDDFAFTGSLSQQYQLVGNAVPPSFAKLIGTSLLNDMRLLAGSAVPQSKHGKLVSFIPTNSLGYSPALRRITEKVWKLFGSEAFALIPG